MFKSRLLNISNLPVFLVVLVLDITTISKITFINISINILIAIYYTYSIINFIKEVIFYSKFYKNTIYNIVL